MSVAASYDMAHQHQHSLLHKLLWLKSRPAVHAALGMLRVFERQSQHLLKAGGIAARFLCFVLPYLPCPKQPRCCSAGYNTHKTPTGAVTLPSWPCMCHPGSSLIVKDHAHDIRDMRAV